ncbi:mannitol dehydrogenase family protein [Microbacterium deminutum]|uniref:Mannitol-1-phosphate 5-dehydrogenase n=1 Tax=Microbacterium deminutum TaxID=344164 RepID=A0ABN2QU07_9MICO
MNPHPQSLDRAALEASGTLRPSAPIRIVHLGLGAFHRAHQAWYTARVDAAGGWGIAAFTGRDATQADLLSSQDCLYTLVERGPERDRVELIPSIVEAVPGSNVQRLLDLLADPAVAVVTLTITEAGYRVGPDGRIDLADEVVAGDLRRMAGSANPPHHEEPGSERLDRGQLVAAAPVAALTRLLAGLLVRYEAGAAPLAIVPCDNLPHNAALTRAALVDLAGALPLRIATPAFRAWLAETVAFVSTSVDRITPRSTPEVASAARAAGWNDAVPIVTEPFHDWVLSGDFPAGRPAWERAGARFVDDIDGWEHRKLWLLNGAHTILAASGLRRGHTTVAQAVADEHCLALVEGFWVEAVQELGDDIEHVEYRAQLLERFRNGRIEHQLRQIAADSTTKARVRVAGIAERRLARAEDASGCLRALAAWVDWVVADGDAPDSNRADLDRALAANHPAGALIRLVSPAVAEDPAARAEIIDALGSIAGK